MADSDDTRALFEEYLHYLPQFKVLVCKVCRFAIQPSAVGTHLKQHHIYRSKRQKLLQHISTFELDEPAEVQYPPVGYPALTCLPVHNGWRCQEEGCDYSSASRKRMRGHWTTFHGRSGTEGLNWRPAALQTFFRGNQLRYFEVTADETISPPSRQSEEEADAAEQSQDSEAVSLQSSLPDHPFNMEDLMLFHHYLTSTCGTLSRGSEPAGFWSHTAPQIARDHSYLMHALLGIAATHLALLRPNESYANVACRHQNICVPDYRKALAHRNPNAAPDPMIICSRSLMFQNCAWLGRNPLSDKIASTGDEYVDCHAHVRILHWIRGGCTLLLDAREAFVGAGMSACLLPPRPETAFIPQMDPFLSSRLQQLSEAMSRHLPKDELREIEQLWLTLCSSFALSSASQNPSKLWDGVEMWTSRLRDSVMYLFRGQNSAALVVLAHFTILVRLLEDSNWYMTGCALAMYQSIKATIDPTYYFLLEWPEHELWD